MAGEHDVSGATGSATLAAGVLDGREPAGAATEPVGDPADGVVRLPNRPESASAARRLTACVLHHRWGVPFPITEDAVLLVSEMVGNAVRHTGAQTFGLRVLRRHGWVRVEVHDPSRGLPCLLPVHELDTSGRGLWLIDKLAARWGVDLLPRGKSTWFEMRVPDLR